MNKKPIQCALIVGATSGIGKETALQLLQKGWILGLAGRREENLKELQQLAPERIHIQAIDICQEDATDRLLELIEEMGGMDLYLHCSGIGHQNYQLTPEIELRTLETNGTGFVRMVTAAFHYFAQQKKRTPGRHQLHRGNQRAGSCSGLFCHQTFPKHVHRCAGATGSHPETSHPVYRHPSGIRGHRTPERRQTLSHADAYGESGPPHCACPGEKETHCRD